MKKSIWDKFSAFYNPYIALTNKKLYSALVLQLKRDVGGTENLAEIATGTGILAIALAGEVKYIEAADISRDMLKIAVKNADKAGALNIRFSVQDINRLSYPDNAFDAVIAGNVIHLLSRPEYAVEELKRIVKPKGKIILPTFLLGESALTRIYFKIAAAIGFPFTNLWSREDYISFLRQNGLETEKFCVINGFPRLGYALIINK